MTNSLGLNKGDKVNTPLGTGEFRHMERLGAGCRDRYLVKLDDKVVSAEYGNKLVAFWVGELS